MNNIRGYDFILKFSFKEVNRFESSFSRCPKKKGSSLVCSDDLSFEIDYLDWHNNEISLQKITEKGESKIKSLKCLSSEFDVISVKKGGKILDLVKIINGYISNIRTENEFIYICCMIDDKKLNAGIFSKFEMKAGCSVGCKISDKHNHLMKNEDDVISIPVNFNEGGGIDKNEIEFLLN
jgi:hypothetical protein